MRNVLLDELHESARLICGPAQARNRPLGQVTGIEDGAYEAAMLIGYHCRAGTSGGLLAHTWVGRLVHEIRIQGRVAGEALLNAYILGHYGVPVVLATGADDFVQEVRADLGEDLACVEVKKTLGPSACSSLTPKRAQALIREAAERAVDGRAGRKPLVADPPVNIEVHFHAVAMQERALELGGEPIDTRGIRYSGPDAPATVKEVWRGLAHTLREEAAFLK